MPKRDRSVLHVLPHPGGGGDTYVDVLGSMPRVDHRWAGIFGLTQDLVPLVGPIPGRAGTWVAAGYSGHGNVLVFLCGEIVASAIRGHSDSLLQLFEPARLLPVETA